MKKNTYSRKLGGALTESKVTTRKPKLTNFGGAKIVTIGNSTSATSSAQNLAKKSS